MISLVLLIWFVICLGPIMTTKFSDSVGLSRQKDFLLAVLKEVKRECHGSYFDTWYYALRYVSYARLEDLQRLLAAEPHGAASHEESYAISQIQGLFKKRKDLDHEIDPDAAALESFLISERVCSEMNGKLRNPDDPYYKDRAALIHKMQRKISEVLGSVPPLDTLDYGFGPGQNVGCSKNTNVAAKLSVGATITVDALPLLKEALSTPDVYWPGLSRLTVVDSSRFATVPKTWKTSRGIMIEPIVNTFLQKGFGSYIRQRLLIKAGINLQDQSINRRRALIGSKDGSLATIDLSMASDTISSILVLDLLPLPWFDALYSCRCHRTTLPGGSVVELEKFSSMGNGYTFELESLIFWALCNVVAGADVSVYGDDLIVPTESYAEVVAALELLGFIPNKEKSFGDGPFRESCGGDYFGGVNVRPFFLKDKIKYSDLFRVYNWSISSGRLEGLRAVILRMIPESLKVWGPASTGDGHLHTDNLPVSRDKRGWGGFHKYKTYVAVPCKYFADEEADFCAFLYWRTYKSLGEITYESVGRNVRPYRPRYVRKTLTFHLP